MSTPEQRVTYYTERVARLQADLQTPEQPAAVLVRLREKLAAAQQQLDQARAEVEQQSA